MKKLLLLLMVALFVVGCGNGEETENGETPVQNVDNLEVLHPQSFHDLVTMFEELTYEYETEFSDEKMEVSYEYGGQEEINGSVVSKLILDLDGEDASLYVNDEGEEVKIVIRGDTYTSDQDGFRVVVSEIRSKMPKILNLPTEHITKRDRDRNTLVGTESVTIGTYTGTKEMYDDTSESSITGETTHTIKHLGIFDDFMLTIYEEREDDHMHVIFEIKDFKVR